MSGMKSATSLVAAVVVAGGLAMLLPAQAFAQFSIPIPFGPGGLRFEPNYRNRAPSHHATRSHSEDSSSEKSDKSKERDATEVDTNANANGGKPSPTGPTNTASHSEESSAPVRSSGSGSSGGKSYDDQPSFAPSR